METDFEFLRTFDHYKRAIARLKRAQSNLDAARTNLEYMLTKDGMTQLKADSIVRDLLA